MRVAAAAAAAAVDVDRYLHLNRPRPRTVANHRLDRKRSTTAERTLGVAPFLKALFKLYKMGHDFASAIW